MTKRRLKQKREKWKERGKEGSSKQKCDATSAREVHSLSQTFIPNVFLPPTPSTQKRMNSTKVLEAIFLFFFVRLSFRTLFNFCLFLLVCSLLLYNFIFQKFQSVLFNCNINNSNNNNSNNNNNFSRYLRIQNFCEKT